MTVAIPLMPSATPGVDADGTYANGTVWLKARQTGDTQPRFQIDEDGVISWGSGSATPDTSLYRHAADHLRTDDPFQASGGLSVGGATPVSGEQRLASGVTIRGGQHLELRSSLFTPGNVVLRTDNATMAVIIRGAAAQTANLLEIQDSTNAVKLFVGSLGENISIQRDASNRHQLVVDGTAAYHQHDKELRFTAPGSGTARLTIGTDGGITMTNSANIALGTGAGTKIGTATTQKLAFWNATPVVQPAAIADASGGAVIDTQARTAINALLAAMRTLGLIAT